MPAIKDNPLLYHLVREPWQWFLTPTFEGKKAWSESSRHKLLHAFLRSTSKRFGKGSSRKTRMESLLWIARAETGEINGRPHFHLLLNGFCPGFVNPTSKHWMKHQWETVLNAGFLDCRRYSVDLSGAEYLLKNLEADMGWSLEGANAYEVTKFGNAETMVSISRSCLRKWARMATNDGLLKGQPRIAIQNRVA